MKAFAEGNELLIETLSANTAMGFGRSVEGELLVTLDLDTRETKRVEEQLLELLSDESDPAEPYSHDPIDAWIASDRPSFDAAGRCLLSPIIMRHFQLEIMSLLFPRAEFKRIVISSILTIYYLPSGAIRITCKAVRGR